MTSNNNTDHECYFVKFVRYAYIICKASHSSVTIQRNIQKEIQYEMLHFTPKCRTLIISQYVVHFHNNYTCPHCKDIYKLSVFDWMEQI